MTALFFSFIVWAFITLSDGSPFLVVLMFLLVGIQAILTGQILDHKSDVSETSEAIEI